MKSHIGYLFAILLFLGMGGCDTPSENHQPSVAAVSRNITCVVPSADTARLFIGGMEPYFTVFDIGSGAMTTYPLPEDTHNWKTYDILRLDDRRWMVAKQNHGIIYMRYDTDTPGNPTIAHVARIKAPDGDLPNKGLNYSVYALLDADTMIVAGTSNGLKYLPAGTLARLDSDTLLTADYVMPLAPMRANRYQFAQESVFIDGDSLVTATDAGLYKVALADFGNAEKRAVCLRDSIRCLYATFNNDSLWVLWSEPDTPDAKYLSVFSRDGIGRSTSMVLNDAAWIGVYGDSVRCFGPEGTFGCFRSAATAGHSFYYIRGGQLRKVDLLAPADESEETARFYDNGYCVSNHMGLWRYGEGAPQYLGNVKGVSEIRGISVDGDVMYMAVADGVYRVSLKSRLLPFDRDAELVEHVAGMNAERVESVFARGGDLLVGTRNGLHRLDLATGKRSDYDFSGLYERFESPYVSRIEKLDSGGYLISTMNHGNMLLAGLDSDGVAPTDIEFSELKVPSGKLVRSGVTWRSLAAKVGITLLLLLALLGLVAAWLSVSRWRHKLALTAMRRSVQESIRRQNELEKIRFDLDKKLEEARRKLNNELMLPVMDVEAAVSRCYPERSTQLDREILKRAAAISDYVARGTVDKEHAAAITRCYMELNMFVERVMETVPALGNAIPEQGIFAACIREYVEGIDNLGSTQGLTLAEQLEWLANAQKLLIQLENKAKQALDAELDKHGANAPVYTGKGLSALWADCLAPIVKSSPRLALAKSADLSGLEKSTIHRTWIVTVFSLQDVKYPQVEGEDLIYDPLSVHKFGDSRHHGTAYSFWLRQLSDDIFTTGGLAFPRTAADLLWRIRLRENPDMEMGLRMAYYYENNMEIPEELAEKIKQRPRGKKQRRGVQ